MNHIPVITTFVMAVVYFFDFVMFTVLFDESIVFTLTQNEIPRVGSKVFKGNHAVAQIEIDAERMHAVTLGRLGDIRIDRTFGGELADTFRHGLI